MNVRCILMDPTDTIYPDSDSPADLAVFWGTVEGYKLKERPYEIEWGTGIDDEEGNEIFSGDVVRIVHRDTDSEGIIHTVIDDHGVVDYFDGAFFIITPSGEAFELTPIYETNRHENKLTITGHRITTPMTA